METALHQEFVQIHDYVRHELQMYVTWFSFFLTLLLGAMGWSLRAGIDKNGRVATPYAFFAMYLLFATQLIFSVIATEAVRNDLANAEQRVASIVETLNERGSAKDHPARSPIPVGFRRALALMHWTLVSNLVFWTLVALAVAWVWRFQYVVQQPATAE